MKVYTFFTDSHKEIMNIFLENFPHDVQTELVIKYFPQECQTGAYMADGWKNTMNRKVDYVRQALDETKEGEWFVHSDCDILLFDGWRDILERHKDALDMMIQDDYSMLCAGFFFCKSNSKTKDLWEKVSVNLNSFDHDQTAMNVYIRRIQDLKVGKLPKSYFTYGYFGRQVWNGETFQIPDVQEMKMFHANWTNGVSNKIKLLNEALKQKNV